MTITFRSCTPAPPAATLRFVEATPRQQVGPFEVQASRWFQPTTTQTYILVEVQAAGDAAPLAHWLRIDGLPVQVEGVERR